MSFVSVLAVAAGGALGSVMRFGLSVFFAPYGVLVANLIGCFAIGTVISLLALKTNISQPVHLFLTVGLLGGFTTFSTFSVEAMHWIDTHKYMTAIFYIAISVIGGLAAFILGRSLVKLLA